MKMDRSGLAYLHDVLMTGLAFVAAFYMRVGDQLFGYHYDGLVQGLPVVMLTGAITYRLFGLYRGIWRYASTPDLIGRADLEQEKRLLPLDLANGRVVAGHPLYPWFLEHGATRVVEARRWK